jgi:tripartite ATP-independent transporter DctM subunit
MTGIGVILLFLLFVILKVPIAISMGIPSFLYIYSHGISITAVSHRMVNSLNSVPLLAVPLFILAGNLMNTSGISDRIFRSARIFVGRMKGGLAQVNVLASLIFSGISGAALADVGGLGNVEIRAMREQGYPDEQSAAITAASATIGPIFPPSIPLIIFGTVAEVSGIRLLIAGIVPALIITVFLMLEVTWLARKYDWPRDTLPLTWKDRFKILGSSVPALLAPLILILGLVSGTFSPTELAGFAVFYMIIINVLFYHEVSWKSFISTVRETLVSTANILFIVSAAAIFAWVLTVEQLPVTISNLFLYITDNPYLLGWNVHGDHCCNPGIYSLDCSSPDQSWGGSCSSRGRNGFKPDDRPHNTPDRNEFIHDKYCISGSCSQSDKSHSPLLYSPGSISIDRYVCTHHHHLPSESGVWKVGVGKPHNKILKQPIARGFFHKTTGN